MFVQYSFTQQLIEKQGKSFELNTQDDGVDIINANSYIYTARDYIKLLPGFNYKAENDNTFVGKIDEFIVCDVDYIPQDQVPDVSDYQINTSLSVGATQGISNVSNTGAATYTIPVFTPKGTAGMEPNISITYNSQSGNGVLGWMWHLSGLSAITRVPKNVYFDNEVGSINLDNNDRFALDGNRLILMSPCPTINEEDTYGQNDTEYKTEINNFSTITFYKNASGESYFIVNTKEGLTLEYGNTDDSKLNPIGSQETLVWYINKITDRFSNFMKFIYKNENGECVIQEIKYTGNTDANLLPYNRILFFYEKRTVDPNKIFFAGHAIKSEKLLYKIRVESCEETVRTYNFKYTSDFYSKLIEVVESGRNNEEINSTIVSFPSGEASIDDVEATEIEAPFLAGYDLIPVDFNGDGLTDIVAAKYATTTNEGFKYYTEMVLYKSTPTGFLCINTILLPAVTFLTVIDTKTDIKIPNSLGFLANDFDGDGTGDILLYNVEPFGLYQYNVKNIKIYYGSKTLDENIFSNSTDILSSTDPYNRFTGMEKNFLHVGDFDGDGNTDIFTILKWPTNNNRWKGTIYFPSKEMSIEFTCDDILLLIARAHSVRIVDINGNGKQELMVVYNSIDATWDKKGDIYEFGSVIPISISSISTLDLHLLSTLDIFYTGDFNGDGKTDLLIKYPDNSWYIGYSRGNSFKKIKIDQDFISDSNFLENNVLIGDFNGDGKYDISYGHCIYYFNGYNNFIKRSWLSGFIPAYFQKCTGDFNGDGKHQVILYGNSSYGSWIVSFNHNKRDLFVKKILNGYNNYVEFQYNPITTGPELYSQSSSSDFFKAPIYVVNSVLVPNGIDNTDDNYNTIVYSYADAKYYKDGKGFAGFGKVTKKNISTNLQIENCFSFDNTRHISLPSQSIKKVSGQDISSTEYEYFFPGSYLSCSGYIYFFPYIKKITEINHLNETQTITNNGYSNDGNLVSKTINYGSDVCKIISYEYDYDAAGLTIPHKISHIKTMSKYLDNTSYYFWKDEDFTYSSANGSLTSYEKDDITTTYENYDDFGNPWKITASADDMPSRTTLFEYDNKGRFLIKQTNPYYQSVSYEYDQKIGKLIKKTDINNHSSTYKYDNFGRLIKSVSPEDIVTDISYNWSPDGQIPNALYYKSITATNAPEQEIYYDRLNRELCSKIQSYNNNFVLNDKQYNQKGELISESEPYFEGEIPSRFTTYKYFDDSRLKKIISPNNTVEYSYSGTTVTTDIFLPPNPEQTFSKTYNAFGDIISATDAGGTISYHYHSSGQVNTITYNGKKTTIEYDNYYGRQKYLDDPNAGITRYEYNGFGELKKQTDANDKTYEMNYDQLGRLITKTYTETGGIYNYIYDTQANGKGLLSSFTAPNGNSTTYQYDNLSRINSITETTDGQNFTTSYQYDQYGNISETTCPSGFAVTQHYNQQGYLSKIKRADNNSLIWKGETTNALGQFTQYTKGNDIITQTFNDFGMPEHIYSENGTQNYGLGWDISTGNLLSRQDNIKGLSEGFEYDNLNRLTYSLSSGPGPWAIHFPSDISYENNGNIDSKTFTGIYSYESPKPNAVTTVESDPTCLMSQLPQVMTYTPFNKAKTITEGDYELNIIYGPDNQRRKSELKYQGNVQKTIFYGNGYEKIIMGSDIYEVDYISSSAGLAAINVSHNGTDNMYYVYTDHLGSLLTITDASGDIIYEQNFDAWGNKRGINFWNLSSDLTIPPPWLIRGFTGHEHLPEFALINMNGRMYDPVLGTFISPDNYVQLPDFTQGLNRYSYALNNPLVFTDPDGEWVWIAIGAVAGYYLGSSSYMGNYEIWNFSSWWSEHKETGAWKQGVIGAIMGAGVGSIVQATSTLPGLLGSEAIKTGLGVHTLGWEMASEALITANVNIGMSLAQGKDLTHTYYSALIGLGAGAVGGYVGTLVNRGGRIAGGAIYKRNWSPFATTVKNLTTSTLSGYGRGVLYGYEHPEEEGDPWLTHGGLGFIGGFVGGGIGSLNIFTTIGRGDIWGHHISSFISSSLTIIPPHSITIGAP
jgi:RHS repeat-associated protein